MGTKAPIRTCIACQATSEKRDLVRFVRRADGTVALDETGKAPGRGAYVCADAACFEKTRAKQMLGGRLRTTVGSEDYERLNADFDAYVATTQASCRG